MTAWEFIDKHIKTFIICAFLGIGLWTGSIAYKDIVTTVQRYIYMTAHAASCDK